MKQLPVDVLLIVLKFLPRVNYFTSYPGKINSLLESLMIQRNCFWMKNGGCVNIIMICFCVSPVNCLCVWKIMWTMIIWIWQRMLFWIDCFLKFFLFVCGIIYFCVIGHSINLICPNIALKCILNIRKYQTTSIKNCM